MKIKNLFVLSATFLTVVFYSCKKDSDEPANTDTSVDKCATKNLVIGTDLKDAAKCKNDGEIVVHASGSAGFTYQINDDGFKTDSIFSGLAGGNYKITIKDADGCTKEVTVAIADNGVKGPLFTAVSDMMSIKCNLACHSAGANSAPKGIFDTDCGIVDRASLIKTKAYDGTMGNLNSVEKKKILDWVNAGGGFTD
jgi:VCBS repeat-containing protein